MSRQKNKVISDTSGDEDKKSRSKSNKSEKKSVKKKSRHANGSSFGSECDMPSKSNKKTKESRIGGYVDEENAAEREGDMNSHHSQTRRKRDRKQKKSSRSVVDGDEEARTAPSSSSNMVCLDYMSEMGNHDPIDDYGEDYDMSDDDEEEPRLAEHANGDIRCALILSVTCISIAVACLVIFREEFLDWVVFGLLGMGP